MVYTATVLPFQVFFITDIKVLSWTVIEIIVSVFFFIDMVQNFNVATPGLNGKLETNRSECGCAQFTCRALASVSLRLLRSFSPLRRVDMVMCR